ncbi:uncharacterized protein C11orf86 homolog isoform X1 [Ochotona princeps]|uniref:uncharacterized protein C11orf86 homolog isoform X1 n=1 Tax=Ochotona princeps TaxID=9978 RepID=UPI002714C309|nr:uncharacterized protein C11orf86 homolog isoform X1 [Ochotona princeps]
MVTGMRSQSLRGPRPTYGKLQDSQGRPLEGRPRRALSLRQERDRGQQDPEGDPEGPSAAAQEWLPGGPGDTEQLIQARRGSRRWLKQYQQQMKRRWESLVASIPGLTLSRSSASREPLDIAS